MRNTDSKINAKQCWLSLIGLWTTDFIETTRHTLNIQTNKQTKIRKNKWNEGRLIICEHGQFAATSSLWVFLLTASPPWGRAVSPPVTFAPAAPAVWTALLGISPTCAPDPVLGFHLFKLKTPHEKENVFTWYTNWQNGSSFYNAASSPDCVLYKANEDTVCNQSQVCNRVSNDYTTYVEYTLLMIPVMSPFNPYTPKNHQCHTIFSCSLARNITSHSMKNLAFHHLLRWKSIILTILITSLIHFSLGRSGECTFWTWEWKG